MTTSLVTHINFYSMAKYGNNILLLTAEEIPDIDPYTKDTYINYPPLLAPYHTTTNPSPWKNTSRRSDNSYNKPPLAPQMSPPQW